MENKRQVHPDRRTKFLKPDVDAGGYIASSTSFKVLIGLASAM